MNEGASGAGQKVSLKTPAWIARLHVNESTLSVNYFDLRRAYLKVNEDIYRYAA